MFNLLQHIQRRVHQVVQRVRAVRGVQRIQAVFEGQRRARHHGVEQVGLVLEVPVDRPSRDPGFARNVLQRGARHALPREQGFGGIEQGLAGLEGVFLGAAHGNWDKGPLPDRDIVPQTSTYVRECMYSHVVN